MIPWFEWPYIYDVRARPNVIQSTSGSRDLQMVKTAPSSMTMLVDAFTGSRAAEGSSRVSVHFISAFVVLPMKANIHLGAGEHWPACPDKANACKAA